MCLFRLVANLVRDTVELAYRGCLEEHPCPLAFEAEPLVDLPCLPGQPDRGTLVLASESQESSRHAICLVGLALESGECLRMQVLHCCYCEVANMTLMDTLGTTVLNPKMEYLSAEVIILFSSRVFYPRDVVLHLVGEQRAGAWNQEFSFPHREVLGQLDHFSLTSES